MRKYRYPSLVVAAIAALAIFIVFDNQPPNAVSSDGTGLIRVRAQIFWLELGEGDQPRIDIDISPADGIKLYDIIASGTSRPDQKSGMRAQLAFVYVDGSVDHVIVTSDDFIIAQGQCYDVDMAMLVKLLSQFRSQAGRESHNQRLQLTGDARDGE